MRDRNIFDQLPIEEISENTISPGKPLESDSKRNSNFRRRPKKYKPKTDSPESETISLDIIVKDINRLSISAPDQASDMESDKVSKKNDTNLNNLGRKKVNGANNWSAFLESTASASASASDESKDTSSSLNIDFKDEYANRKHLNCVAMDCEMVGTGEDKRGNMLARVSIVNAIGECLYDTFVRPTDTITDYRTAVSGVRPRNLLKAEGFFKVQRKVLEIIRGKILVGHAIHNDLIALDIRHPWHMIRDTSRYHKFYSIGFGTPSLKKLTSFFLNVDIQKGEHSSIQDAQATMQLYLLYRRDWETELKQHRINRQRYLRSCKRPKSAHKTKKKHRNY